MALMIRTAFPLPDPDRWTGGYQYYVNLFRVLKKYGRNKVRSIVFVPPDYSDEVLNPLGEGVAEVVRTPQLSSKWSASQVFRTGLLGVNKRALAVCKENDIDAVFASASWYGWRFPLPEIAWLPDFQHRRLPEMFGWQAWARREVGFRAQIASASVIMLSSESARRDCEELYPSSRGRTQVVSFAVEPGEEAFAVSVSDVRARYGLSNPYYYIPNQFWRHKNHALIIEALRNLHDRNIFVSVVASGALTDPRHPRLFQDLVEHARKLGLADHFRFLRFVRRADLYALMRGAIAVVNPSLIEGWSTTVEEAKAIGVPLILSDIAVHREQAGDEATYFDPHSVQNAAAVLGRAAQRTHGHDGALSQAQAQMRNEARLEKYALSMEGLIEQVVSEELVAGIDS
jgi:glycosyltransferase involved in cell wall biosynthesis